MKLYLGSQNISAHRPNLFVFYQFQFSPMDLTTETAGLAAFLMSFLDDDHEDDNHGDKFDDASAEALAEEICDLLDDRFYPDDNEWVHCVDVRMEVMKDDKMVCNICENTISMDEYGYCCGPCLRAGTVMYWYHPECWPKKFTMHCLKCGCVLVE
jgi:hypothetical protein